MILGEGSGAGTALTAREGQKTVMHAGKKRKVLLDPSASAST
jgi:hypothetical protein